jgi:hypothetical protein
LTFSANYLTSFENHVLIFLSALIASFRVAKCFGINSKITFLFIAIKTNNQLSFKTKIVEFRSSCGLVWKCPFKVPHQFAQWNSLLLALANRCWIRGILQCISNSVSNNLKPLTQFL